MDFAKELQALVDKAKAEGDAVEDILDTLEDVTTALQEEVEEDEEKGKD